MSPPHGLTQSARCIPLATEVALQWASISLISDQCDAGAIPRGCCKGRWNEKSLILKVYWKPALPLSGRVDWGMWGLVLLQQFCHHEKSYGLDKVSTARRRVKIWEDGEKPNFTNPEACTLYLWILQLIVNKFIIKNSLRFFVCLKNRISDKGFVSIIYKQLSKLNSKTNNSTKKIGKRYEDIFPQRQYTSRK